MEKEAQICPLGHHTTQENSSQDITGVLWQVPSCSAGSNVACKQCMGTSFGRKGCLEGAQGRGTFYLTKSCFSWEERNGALKVAFDKLLHIRKRTTSQFLLSKTS